jgi:hypothetical protein
MTGISIELAGDWGHMLPRSADVVVEWFGHPKDTQGARGALPGTAVESASGRFRSVSRDIRG